MASAVTLGFLHGLGADHLMAIAAMSVDGRQPAGRGARAAWTAVHFAVGHAMLLALGATAAILFGWVLPAAMASGAEVVGGVMLIAFGLLGLWTVASGRGYVHVHGAGELRHRHASFLPTLMGAIFAVSGLRVLMLLAPFGDRAGALGLPVVFGLVALFGLGILISMSLFGVVLSRVLSLAAVERVGRSAAAVVAVASLALGIYWVGRV